MISFGDLLRNADNNLISSERATLTSNKQTHNNNINNDKSEKEANQKEPSHNNSHKQQP